MQYDVGEGVFRNGRLGYGGGIFNGAIAGLGALEEAAAGVAAAGMGAMPLTEAQAKILNNCIQQYCPGLPPEQQAPCLNECAKKAAASPSGVKPAAPAVTSAPVTVAPSTTAAATATMLPSGMTSDQKRYLAFGIGALLAIGGVYWYSKKKKGQG